MKLSVIALMFTIVSSNAFAGIDESLTVYNRDITNRNAFGLKPVVLPPDPSTNAAPEPPINVEFTGIMTTTLGVKKAYFRIPDTAKPNTFLFPMIAEGDKEYGIEVISVNETDGAVKITHQGSVRTLTFASNGNKANNAALPVMPPPGVPPGIRPNPTMPMPNSAVPPPPTVTTAASFSPAAFGGQSGAMNPPNTINSTVGISSGGVRNIPTRPLRNPVTAESEAALVTSMVNIEVAREMTRDKVASGDMPPLPPTDFSEPAQGPK